MTQFFFFIYINLFVVVRLKKQKFKIFFCVAVFKNRLRLFLVIHFPFVTILITLFIAFHINTFIPVLCELVLRQVVLCLRQKKLFLLQRPFLDSLKRKKKR